MSHLTDARKKHTTLAILVIAGIVSVAALAKNPPPATDSASVIEIKMAAKNYEFEPAVITVKKGQAVRLLITSLDRTHGIEIKGFGINQEIPKNQTATVEFTADKAGAFPFKCSVRCGLGHGRMKGELIVEEK